MYSEMLLSICFFTIKVTAADLMYNTHEALV